MSLFPLFSFLPLLPRDTYRHYGSTLCSPCIEINCILHLFQVLQISCNNIIKDVLFIGSTVSEGWMKYA